MFLCGWVSPSHQPFCRYICFLWNEYIIFTNYFRGLFANSMDSVARKKIHIYYLFLFFFFGFCESSKRLMHIICSAGDIECSYMLRNAVGLKGFRMYGEQTDTMMKNIMDWIQFVIHSQLEDYKQNDKYLVKQISFIRIDYINIYYLHFNKVEVKKILINTNKWIAGLCFTDRKTKITLNLSA